MSKPRPRDQFSTAQQDAWFALELPPTIAPEPAIGTRRLALIVAGVLVLMIVLVSLLVPERSTRTLPQPRASSSARF